MSLGQNGLKAPAPSEVDPNLASAGVYFFAEEYTYE